MLIDNRNNFKNGEYQTLISYLQNELKEGNLSLVSGYYSLQILSKLLPNLRPLDKIRMVLGFIADSKSQSNDNFSIKNESLTITDSLNFVEKIENILEFLQDPKVEIRTKHPDF